MFLPFATYTEKNAPATVFNEIPAGCLASDTLVWLSTTADASGLTLSFRGYARCSAAMLFSLSKQTIPATLLLAALLWGGFTFFYFHRHTKTNASNGQQQENFITFGNLSLSLQEACFYNEQQEKLKLTPMQYTLMEMFYLSSSHLLFKSDICQSLWPGKDNADETLYTLIRRLKPIVEDNSNLRITTDRGRAYGLEIKPKHYRIMKTNKLILLGLICLTVAMPTTAQNRNEKKARTERAVKEAIAAKQYKINVDRMQPMRGGSRNLTTNYTLEIRNDSVFSYLPYFGVAYNAPYGGGKSLNFNASITGYTTRALKKGKIQIDFKTRSDEDNYEYRLTIFPDGSTSIHVQPMNKQSISFTGEMDTEK